jgi:hypothetical protein
MRGWRNELRSETTRGNNQFCAVGRFRGSLTVAVFPEQAAISYHSHGNAPHRWLYRPAHPNPGRRAAGGPRWVHEIKHDGYRLMVRGDGETVRLFTRRGRELDRQLSRHRRGGHQAGAKCSR